MLVLVFESTCDETAVAIGKDGKEEDAFGYLNPSLAISAFVLIPGTNLVEYRPNVPSLDSRVEIAWQSCYEGV